MSTQAVETFLKSLDKDEALKKEFEAEMAKTADAGHVVAFASTRGFDFTADELEQHAASFAQQPPAGELSDEQMGGVVGGFGLAFPSMYSKPATQLLRDVYFAGVVANRLM